MYNISNKYNNFLIKNFISLIKKKMSIVFRYYFYSKYKTL